MASLSIHRTPSLPAIVGISWLLASCGPGGGDAAADSASEEPEALEGPVELLESPAGPGSGEPNLSPGEDGPVLSWLEPDERQEGVVHLRMARLREEGWGDTSTIHSGEDFFVNWADFPMIAEIDGVLVGHWLERGGSGGYDYGVRVTRSADGGGTWTAGWTPHEDGTATEHGFVAIFPDPAGGAGVVWLDGRRYAADPGGGAATDEMTLRTRTLDLEGAPTPELLLDGRVCDCCQTDAVVTSEGPLVVYRDRSADEIRDIHVVRRVDGRWEESRPVHEDGWRIAACPVNGPAAAARGTDVAVAWFTGADDRPRVQVAFSGDAGASFGPPVPVDDGDPAGRVDVALLEDGSALVSWIERTRSAENPEGAELRVRRIRPDGRRSGATVVSASSAARASGFPRMVVDGPRVLWAWTDVGQDPSRVRVASAPTGAW